MSDLKRAITCLCIAAPQAVACQAFVGEYEPDLEIVSSMTDPGALCDSESHFTFTVDLESKEQKDDLTAYYEAANSALVAHLMRAAEQLHQGETQRRSSYLWGAAGVGKSFVTRNAFDAFEDDEQCAIDLGEAFADGGDRVGYPTELRADLATLDGELVFNELPTLSDSRGFELTPLLEAGGCIDGDLLRPLVILDSIDELHDDCSRAVLEAVDELLLSDSGMLPPFFHVVVAGRPGGFVSWLTDPGRNETNPLLDIFELKAPRYDSAGSIEFRVVEYLDFANELAALEADDGVEAFVQRVIAAVVEYPFLGYSLGNLAVGNVVIQHTGPERVESEQELKTGIFDDMVYRNSQSHGRPGDGAELEAAYLRVLEDIAARYLDVSEQGAFVVRSEDVITVVGDDGEPLGEVRVRNVLNRGGVAVLSSATSTTTRYRFEPFWLHAHLTERRNQRLNPDYVYRGCE